MPVNTLAGGRKATHLFLLLALIAGVLVVLGLADAFAQNPFGAPRAPAAPPPPRRTVRCWILAKQAEFYSHAQRHDPQRQDRRQRGLAADGHLVPYGIFHAAGPATARR